MGVGVRLRPLKSMVQVVLRQSPCSSASEPSPTGHCSDAEAASFADAVPMSVNQSKLAGGEAPSPSATLRVAGCAILGAIQYVAARALLPSVWDEWPPIRTAHALANACVLATVIFALAAWPRRTELLGKLRHLSNGIQTRLAVPVYFASLALLFLFRLQLAQTDPATGAAWALGYPLLVLTTATSLFLLAAPITFWSSVLKSWRLEAMIAAGVTAIALLMGLLPKHSWAIFLSKENWELLIVATLQFSYWILALFQDNAFMDPGTRILGAGNFSVQIFGPCSGYEGMALVAVFLVGYLCIFRRSLRFPNVLILFPVGMAVIWLLNAVRIALLVWIGTNVSPEIALGGFHSQFGWMCFLLVAITIMTSAQRISFFAMAAPAPPSGNPDRLKVETNYVLVFLAPFIALMAAQILVRAASPYEHALYAIKVVAVAIVLYCFRHMYARMWNPPSSLSLLIGIASGLLWIATDSNSITEAPLGSWLAQLTPVAFVAWLIVRAIGSIFMVPIAEELAFRGYLYRVIISTRFEEVDFRTFSWVALIVSSVLFGFMHDRWLSAAFAGAVYALLMCRSGQISDAIAAHMVTNAVVFGWAVALHQWSLL